MKYKCDCESSYCSYIMWADEKTGVHEAGKCIHEARFYATIFGITQHLCEGCFNQLKHVDSKDVQNVYAIIQAKEN